MAKVYQLSTREELKGGHIMFTTMLFSSKSKALSHYKNRLESYGSECKSIIPMESKALFLHWFIGTNLEDRFFEIEVSEKILF
jgi:hypothetical protein